MSGQSPGTLLQFGLPSSALPGEGLFNEIRSGKFAARFARTKEEIDLALRLRFKVFNLEFGEGRATSFSTGRDEDEFDSISNHLLLIDQSRRQVIGTCRMRTYEIAKTIEGFYSSIKFDLSAVPPDVLGKAVEFDRACIAEPYRKTRALLLLWKGLALYSLHHQKSFFFSCCSLNSQDPTEGGRVFDLIGARQQHRDFRVNARPGFKCLWYQAPDGPRNVSLMPQPLRTYLRLGANVCGPPALDRRLRTIDFFVVMDVNRVERRVRRLLFPSPGESNEFARSA